jgi:predicted ribosomally synthesized peptide with nif11-like leader
MANDANGALERMENDDDLAVRVRDAGGPDASLNVLRAEGFDVTAEAMRNAVLDHYGDRLTPEELDAVAGGLGTDKVLADAPAVPMGTLYGQAAAAAAI